MTTFLEDLGRRTGPPDRIVRLIILYKSISAFFLLVAALVLFGILANPDLGRSIRDAMIDLSERTDLMLIRRMFSTVGLLSDRSARTLGIISFFYACLEATEAIGLARSRRWAEYLVVLATGFFLPYELLDVIRHPTTSIMLAFVGNVVILIYIIHAKRLFRGEARYLHMAPAIEHEADRPQVRTSPAPE